MAMTPRWLVNSQCLGPTKCPFHTLSSGTPSTSVIIMQNQKAPFLSSPFQLVLVPYWLLHIWFFTPGPESNWVRRHRGGTSWLLAWQGNRKPQKLWRWGRKAGKDLGWRDKNRLYLEVMWSHWGFFRHVIFLNWWVIIHSVMHSLKVYMLNFDKCLLPCGHHPYTGKCRTLLFLQKVPSALAMGGFSAGALHGYSLYFSNFI